MTQCSGCGPRQPLPGQAVPAASKTYVPHEMMPVLVYTGDNYEDADDDSDADECDYYDGNDVCSDGDGDDEADE